MDAKATNLKLFIDNDGNLYERMTTGILRNLMAKKARGQYKHDLAVKALGYLTEAGAKKYVRDGEISIPWHKMFDVATRKRVSEELTKAFESACARGEYNWLLPEKKLKTSTSSHSSEKPRGSLPDHARKKTGPYTPPSRGKGGFDAGVNAALTDTNKPRSFVARFHSTDGRPMLGGGMRAESSHFSHREDAENFLAASIENNASAGRSVSGEVVPSTLRAQLERSVSGKPSTLRSSHARKKGGTYDTSAKAQAARSSRLKAIEARRAANTAAQESISSTSGGISARDIWEFSGFLRGASDRQLQGIYEKEKRAGRDEYVEVTRDEAGRRGVELYEDSGGGRNDHARKKQLDREILQVVPSYRWRS